MSTTLVHTTVLGKGVFGQAIGSLLEENGVDFAYVDIDLPMVAVTDLVFITVPTQFIRTALNENLRWFKPSTVFVNCAKGIEQTTHELPFEIVRSVLDPAAYYTLVGPSFASEIVNKQPTLVSLGHEDDKHIEPIKSLVQTSYFRIREAHGYQSLELASAMKNVYAIICGYASGLGYQNNTRAKLITLALGEVAQLADAVGFAYKTIISPGIVGDMILTCSSTESRNFRFGHNLATMDLDSALANAGSTVEGYYTSKSIQAICERYGVRLPLAMLTETVIQKGHAAIADFHDFIATR